MACFASPIVYSNPDGWGPPPAGEHDGLGLFEFAIESLDKYPLSKIGRICDFSASGQRFAEQRAAKGKGKGKGFQAFAPPPGKDDDGFALVDTRPVPGKSSGRGRGMKAKGKGRGPAVNYQQGILGQKQKPFFSTGDNSNSGKGKGKARGRGQPRRGLPSFKEWSVETKTEWTVRREVMLTTLCKLSLDSRLVQRDDVMWCGQLHEYNKDFDKINARTKKTVARFEDLNFFNVSTSDDPILPEMLQNDSTVSVIATDHVLACLIAAARSVYSWDIVVTKINDRLIFDKRDGSQIDFLTVNETAQDPPNNDDKDSINSPLKLGREASCINQNFSQMVLDYTQEADQMAQPNPFEEEDEGQAASGVYRYQKFTLPGNPRDSESEFNRNPVTMIVRTEVNCKMPETGALVSVKALNEYNPKANYSWVQHLDTQRGMVLGNELKNNSFKLGRWTAQAILAGCDLMKIGYATRSAPEDPWNHQLLGVMTHHTDSFADQIGISRNNLFGILRNIIDMVMSFEDGKYLLLKDPTKAVMRVYEVPWDAFGDDEDGEGDEEGDDGEGQELDDEGNVIPVRH